MYYSSWQSVDMAYALNMSKSLVMGSWVHDSTSVDDRQAPAARITRIFTCNLVRASRSVNNTRH